MSDVQNHEIPITGQSLEWLDADRKTYIKAKKHQIKLMPLDAPSGVSMVVVPVDDPAKPSKVFVVEVSQPVRGTGDATTGVLIYSVDGKLASGQNAVVVYPTVDPKSAPLQTGETFEDKDAPMTVRVLKRNEDGRSYLVEVDIKERK